jgi:hypothetical protein
LERLFGDMERLKTSCGMFAAGFVLATAYLSEHEKLRSRPVFWRRLAAASHASLIVRTCGVTPIKQDELVSWALRLSGTAYFASVLADMHAEPRWRPEWLFPNFLIADCFGRARNAVALLANPRPARADILAFKSGGGGETWRRKASNSLIQPLDLDTDARAQSNSGTANVGGPGGWQCFPGAGELD